MKKFKNKSHKGQAILEYIFAMFMVALLVYGTVKVWEWTGLDLRDRRVHHEESLTNHISGAADSPLQQIDPFFHQVRRIKGVYPNPKTVDPFDAF